MRLDTLALRLRARTPLQAGDLGVRLCQTTLRQVYAAFAVVALPVVTLALATSELAAWLPLVVMWWAAPWFDRTILFVLSRAAFGQPTTPLDLWRARRVVWWRHWWFTLTARRLSPWRPLTDPVYLLEGLPVGQAGRRARQVRRRQMGAGLMITHTFAVAELCLLIAMLSLLVWFAPQGLESGVREFLFDGPSSRTSLIVSGAYGAVMFFLEPFYVATGFAVYLNRRAELEGWDIEQEFRRAFAA
ncbi:MAG TPA: hypothetical protein VM032_03790 [Vicinamibacterales bacterium]|nr:hypothetical protein [Vicinamibacterales bacterium]